MSDIEGKENEPELLNDAVNLAPMPAWRAENSVTAGG